jgi:hypothetical protein
MLFVFRTARNYAYGVPSRNDGNVFKVREYPENLWQDRFIETDDPGLDTGMPSFGARWLKLSGISTPLALEMPAAPVCFFWSADTLSSGAKEPE